MNTTKFILQCQTCQEKIEDFNNWFGYGQQCPQCGSKQVYVEYQQGYENLIKTIRRTETPASLWHYLDYLPLNESEHIVSFSEGIVPIDRWTFIEDYARERHNINCKIYAHRYDLNTATGTFKDMAATVVASVLKENGQKSYVGASTGNIANAYAKYLSAAGILFYAFIPCNSSDAQEAGIASFAQKVFRVAGDYSSAKQLAADFAVKHHMILAAGNFDPMRIEAKKTMVYEWLRQLDEFPTVYIQALSGGTGPLGIAKAYHELKPLEVFSAIPRQILVQSDKCAPMAMAWETAKAQNFPAGWEKNYPVIENPETAIPTLSTGNPKTYPVLAPFVKETCGEIIACDENKAVDVGRLIAAETAVLTGPAAALPIGGIFRSLQEGHIKDGDVVLVNVGENMGRSPDFLTRFVDNETPVHNLNDCKIFDRKQYIQELWERIYHLYG